jgi:AraC-like DNA-binding protein
MRQPKRMKKHILDAIHAVKTSIDANPFDSKTINTLTKAAHRQVGRNCLQQCFRQIAGISLRQYEKLKRMEAAAVMLEEGRLSFKEIADRCGYSTQSSFTRGFRETHGMTPSEYQQRVM